MNFVKLTENNDNEGESWNFWLQLDQNGAQLSRLAKIIDLANDAGFDEAYELDMTSVDESEVDILIKHTDSGYMDYENKVIGKLELPKFDNSLFVYEDEVDDAVFEWLNDNLYKGDIVRWFK